MRLWIALLAAPLVFAGWPLRAQRPPHFELGGGYASIGTRANLFSCGGCIDILPGLGGYFDARLARWLGFDAEVDFFPELGSGATSEFGGRITEGLFGARLGTWFRLGRSAGSRNRLGVFFLLRPGVMSFGDVSQIESLSPTFVFRFHRKTDNVLNFGGATVLQLSPRTGLRFEMGDTIIFGQPVALGAPRTHTHNLQAGVDYVFFF